MNMKWLRNCTIGGIAAFTVAGGMPGAASASAGQDGEVGTQYYPCGSRRPTNLDTQGFPLSLTDVNARSGSATSCSINGLIRRYDRLDYYCWTVGGDQHSWTYVSAFERGIAGWVPDSVLPGGGSSRWCGK